MYQVLLLNYGKQIYKASLPYDSKACFQHAYGLRHGFIQALRTEWFNKNVFEVFQGLISTIRLI